MKRYLKRILISVIVLILAIAVLIFGFMQGWHIKKRTPDQLALLLTPYFKIKTPPGKGPFPTILYFHGSSGLINPDGRMWKGAVDWTEYLAGLGYAIIYVDSFTGRSIPSIRNNLKHLMFNNIKQQPGDILVAISEARKLSFVDKEQLALIGKSAGALAIMDTFAMNPPQEIPANLINAPDNPLAGVKAAILFYPYCDNPAKAKGKGWIQNIPVLMLMGGKDPYTKSCLEIVTILENKRRPVRAHVYPSAQHGFDGAPEDRKYFPSIPSLHDTEATADARQRVKEFLAEVFHKI
ncbi:MAG: dienelactone hydrolase family protein [Acidobacteria bacterium]|nr:dienelactone hydrolase family protein [Acidobacteriota bacterium]